MPSFTEFQKNFIPLSIDQLVDFKGLWTCLVLFYAY